MYAEVFFADEYDILSNVKVIFVYRRPATFVIRIYERLDTMVATVFIVSNGIMGRIQQEFSNMGFWEEMQHVEIVKKAMGIRLGG